MKDLIPAMVNSVTFDKLGFMSCTLQKTSLTRFTMKCRIIQQLNVRYQTNIHDYSINKTLKEIFPSRVVGSPSVVNYREPYLQNNYFTLVNMQLISKVCNIIQLYNQLTEYNYTYLSIYIFFDSQSLNGKRKHDETCYSRIISSSH